MRRLRERDAGKALTKPNCIHYTKRKDALLGKLRGLISPKSLKDTHAASPVTRQ